jgi:hypothetical protein
VHSGAAAAVLFLRVVFRSESSRIANNWQWFFKKEKGRDRAELIILCIPCGGGGKKEM